MQIFLLIWFGQLVSLMGSGLTSFALGVWIYQHTGSVINFALIYFFTELPGIIIAPIAGAIADRKDRRTLMIFSNVGAGVSSLVIALLMFAGGLKIWHIYLAITISSTCNGFQQPAYLAATTLLVPKKHYARASGMVQVGKAAEQLFSPIVAGVLVATIQIQGVLLIDFITFIFALLTLLIFRFPQPPKTSINTSEKTSLLSDAGFGWTYIKKRPGLLIMVIFFAITNFSIGIAQVLLTPMILSFTDAKMLGVVLSLGGSGWLFGSLAISIWGGPKRRIYGILGFELLLGMGILMAGLRSNVVLITIAIFSIFFSVPMIIGCNNAIWQSKVPSNVQGRVFAVRGMISWSTFPLAYLVAGLLADRIFQPLLEPNGLLAQSLGLLIGVGAGRGIGLLFMVVGTLIVLTTIAAYRYPRLWRVEDEIPDAIH